MLGAAREAVLILDECGQRGRIRFTMGANKIYQQGVKWVGCMLSLASSELRRAIAKGCVAIARVRSHSSAAYHVRSLDALPAAIRAATLARFEL